MSPSFKKAGIARSPNSLSSKQLRVAVARGHLLGLPRKTRDYRARRPAVAGIPQNILGLEKAGAFGQKTGPPLANRV
jgi:hypothetical protein